MDNTIVWADIPVTDLDRAMKFYGAVLQREFKPVEGMDGVALEAPPADFDPSSTEPPFPVAFDLAVVQDRKPSADGCTIYPTRRVVAAIQRDGTCWCGPTVWQGHTAMRISVSSWATTDADVDRSVRAMLEVARR